MGEYIGWESSSVQLIDGLGSKFDTVEGGLLARMKAAPDYIYVAEPTETMSERRATEHTPLAEEDKDAIGVKL